MNQGRRRLVCSLNVSAQVLLALWVLLALNTWSFLNSKRVDFSIDKRFSIDEDTVRFLETIEERVDIVIVTAPNPSYAGRLQRRVLEKARRYCEEYQIQAPGVRLAGVVDEIRDPERVEKLKQSYAIDAPNLVYLFSGDRQEVLRAEDLATFRLPTPTEQVQPQITSEHIGEALAAAIRRLVTKDKPKVVFTQGSGELPLNSEQGQTLSQREFLLALHGRGYEVSGVDLATIKEIPADTQVLVVVANADFDPLRGDARIAVERYVRGGGSLLLLAPILGRSGLEGLLGDFGVKILGGRVARVGVSPGKGMGPTFFLQTAALSDQHPLAAGLLDESFMAELDLCRPLECTEPATAVLSSSKESWQELDERFLRRDRRDPAGPFPLVAASEKEFFDEPGRVVVVGSWLPALDQSFHGGMRRLLLHSTNWLAHESVPESGSPDRYGAQRIELTEASLRAFFWVTLFLMPACVVLAGVAVFAIRRR